MNNTYKRIISVLLCSIIWVTSIALPASAEAGKDGTFWAYLYGSSAQTGSLCVPYALSKENINSNGAVLAAKQTATYLKNMPEGRRGIDVHNLTGMIAENRENYIWWEPGTEKLREIFTQYFAALKKEGVELDYVIDDLELEMTNWSINTVEKTEKIVNDPRYKTEIKPLLEERNFRFGEAGKAELYYVANYSADKTAYLIWNNVMDCRIADYYNRAVYEPLKANFPDAKLSNYELVASKGEIPVILGSAHRQYLGGPTKNVGTHSSPVCYGTFIHISYKGKAPEDYPYEQFKATGFNASLVELIKVQDAVVSTDGGKIMPWIGLKSWSGGNYSNFWKTHYYDEFVMHLGLMNPDPFLIYNIGSTNQGEDELLLKDIFSQLDELAGYEDRKTLVTDAFKWDQRYLLTGMYAGGKNVWRITPDLYTPGISTENFLVDKDKLIFQIGNQVIKFPEGSYIYTPSKVISDYGYWVVSPENTYPEEIRVDNIPIPEEPVPTSDFIPTGYTMERNFDTYNPKVHSADKTAQEEVADKNEPVADKEEVKDIPQADASHWAHKELNAALKAGVLVGTDNGLMPDRNITRAEFITMMLRAVKIDFSEKEGTNWYDGPINTARENGWIGEEDDGLTILSREEAARIMIRALKVGATSRRVSFTDMDSISKDMKDSVLDAASLGIINGYPDGTFRPKGNITRAEAVTIIMRSIY